MPNCSNDDRKLSFDDVANDMPLIYQNSFSFVKRIYDLAYSFLLSVLDEEDLTLPIDVIKVADKCNISITVEDFLPYQNGFTGKFSSPISYFATRKASDGNIKNEIFVADYLDEFSKQFVIAREIARSIINKPRKLSVISDTSEKYTGIYPLSTSNDLLCDMIARAMLLPYPLFLQAREAYEKDDSKFPIDSDDWLTYLHYKTQMPEYQVDLAFQSIKEYASFSRFEQIVNKLSRIEYRIIDAFLGMSLTPSEIKKVLFDGADHFDIENDFLLPYEIVEFVKTTSQDTFYGLCGDRQEVLIDNSELERNVVSRLSELHFPQVVINNIEEIFKEENSTKSGDSYQYTKK